MWQPTWYVTQSVGVHGKDSGSSMDPVVNRTTSTHGSIMRCQGMWGVSACGAAPQRFGCSSKPTS